MEQNSTDPPQKIKRVMEKHSDSRWMRRNGYFLREAAFVFFLVIISVKGSVLRTAPRL